jgi:hypothetical protein
MKKGEGCDSLPFFIFRHMKQKTNSIWIPEEIWELDKLNPMQRIFLAKVLALSQKDGSCWAGDEFLSEALKVSPQYVRKLRQQLCKSEFLECEGYGHQRKLTVNLDVKEEATRGASSNTKKQPQLQKKQPEAQDLQPEAQLKATTVAHSIDYNIDKNIEPSIEVLPSKKLRFQKPTLSESMEIFELAGSSRDEGEKFWNYYESNGWKAGRNKMKDWKAAARNWIKRSHEFTNNRKSTKSTPNLDREKLAEYIRTGVVPSN